MAPLDPLGGGRDSTIITASANANASDLRPTRSTAATRLKGPMTSQLQDRVVNRLVETGDADKPLALVVLAALEGESALTAYLDGTKTPASPTPSPATGADKHVEPPGIYVSSVTVEGLRGVGKPATLDLHAGPGLTLVIGRNGSGKSSFAEGLELLLTGHNARWEKRAKAWQEGWRNLHEHSKVAVRAGLVVEGRGPLTVSRVWTGDDPAQSTATAKASGGTSQPLASMGWDDALTTFRPFLSYNELGSLLEDGPSKLYDALSNALGLDELTDVQTTIANARKDRQEAIDAAKAGAAALRDRADKAAQQSADDRLTVVLNALAARPWDLAALDALVRDTGSEQPTQVELLRRLAALAVADAAGVSATVGRLRAAERAREALVWHQRRTIARTRAPARGSAAFRREGAVGGLPGVRDGRRALARMARRDHPGGREAQRGGGRLRGGACWLVQRPFAKHNGTCRLHHLNSPPRRT